MRTTELGENSASKPAAVPISCWPASKNEKGKVWGLVIKFNRWTTCPAYTKPWSHASHPVKLGVEPVISAGEVNKGDEKFKASLSYKTPYLKTKTKRLMIGLDDIK